MTVYPQLTDEMDYEIVVKGEGQGPMPAGPRIFRAPPHPDVRFSGHATLAAAQVDADKIRDYLAGLSPRRQSKKELRTQHD